jgi:hypothetical protein
MYLHTYGVIITRLFMSTPLLLEPSAGYGNTSLISLISLILHVHTCDIPSISPWNLKLFRCFTNLLLYCLLVLQSAPPPILTFSDSPILQFSNFCGISVINVWNIQMPSRLPKPRKTQCAPAATLHLCRQKRNL